MKDSRDSAVQIIRVDRITLSTMDLEGLLCFRGSFIAGPSSDVRADCPVTLRDLLPIVSDRRSGILAAIYDRRIAGYAIFGRAALFPHASEMDFDLVEDALVIAALYVTEEVRKQNADVDLLVAVMDFARENNYEAVQALCRDEPGDYPEPRIGLLSAAGFTVVAEQGDFLLAETTLERWDNPQQGEGSDESLSGILPNTKESK